MPTHAIQSAKLTPVKAEQMVNFNSNELLDLFKEKHGLDLIGSIADLATKVRDHPRMPVIEKLDALRKVYEMTLKLKRSNASEKGGAVTVQVLTHDPRKP